MRRSAAARRRLLIRQNLGGQRPLRPPTLLHACKIRLYKTRMNRLKYAEMSFLSCNRYKDSGGPLIVEDPENDRHVQIGAVYGSLEECTDRNFPSLYARLDDYKILSFIRSTAFGENIAPVAKGEYIQSVQSNFAIRNGLIRNKFSMKEPFPVTNLPFTL